MRSAGFTFLFVIIVAISSFAQSPTYVLDSLKTQLKQAKTDQERVGIYSELTWYWAMVNLDSALAYGKESLALTEKVGDKKAIGQAWSDLGNAYNQKGQFAEAKNAYKKSLLIRTEIADSAGIAGSKSNLASVHQRLYQTDSAMSYYVEALDYYERTGNDRYINFLKNNLAVLHEDMRNFPTALKLYEEVAKYREENQLIYDLALVYNNMGNIYKATKDYSKSEEYLNKALENGFKAGDSLVVSVTYLNLASLFNAADRPDQAIEAANAGIKIAKKVNSLYDQAMMEYALGNSYSLKKEYSKARTSYLSAIKVLEDLEAKEEVSAIQLRLVPVFAALNMPDSAQYYTDLYIDYRNKLTEEQVEELTNEIQTKYETEKKDREIAEQQLAIRNKNLQLYGSLILALALGILGYLLYRQQKLKNQQLKQEAELKAVLAQLETQNKLQEQRLLISRDLHDNIGAQLTFIISAIENLKFFEPVKEQLNQRYDSIASFTKQTITELRDTIWAMNSGQVTWESLAGRVQDYLQKARQSSPGIQFEFSLADSIQKDSTLGSAESIQVLRIIQEAVQNAVKYAEASSIKVEVNRENVEYQVSIQDNGKGFEESEITPGNGLYNMRKRAEELGGVLEISSNPGNGTVILLVWDGE
ncbi:histidine kinase [Algoriphagus boseongensis]|uniref:Histidine kinase n=1 Tax=Algoriphagus boseongensis TaxID=1442587 RepID=A0A4V3D1U5_9BACT|nr:sensor histidine kinase [Algoriphagus boseongensis]TDQ14592.1 histidine kinase [Algoriphagus boseongensis]